MTRLKINKLEENKILLNEARRLLNFYYHNTEFPEIEEETKMFLDLLKLKGIN